jgi:hypothetical protein
MVNYERLLKMDVLTKIDSLAVSDGWKSKFRTIAEAEPISLGLIPKFKNDAVYKNASITTKMNFWAFFFGIFYYITKGMWKKGIVLLAIGIGLVIILGALFGGSVSNAAGFGVAGLFAAFANFDYYRKMVLGEDFWI